MPPSFKDRLAARLRQLVGRQRRDGQGDGAREAASAGEDLLRQVLSWTRHTASLETERLKIEAARFWADEMAKPRNADPRRLLRHGFKIYSQNDEDGIIQEIFRRIGTTDRRFVEFGVQNGFEC